MDSAYTALGTLYDFFLLTWVGEPHTVSPLEFVHRAELSSC